MQSKKMKKMRQLKRNSWKTVVGMVAGGLSLALVSCEEEGDAGGSQAVDVTAKLESALAEQKDLQQEIDRLNAANESKANGAKAEIEAKEDELKELKTELKALKKEKKALETDYKQYQEDYKANIRANAKGVQLGSFALRTGASYKKVVVNKWESDGIRVMHAEGSAKFAFKDLPGKVQKIFAYDPAEFAPEAAETDNSGAKDNVAGKPSDNGASGDKEDPVVAGPGGSKSEPTRTKPQVGLPELPKRPLSRTEIAIVRISRQIEAKENEVNRLDKLINVAYRPGGNVRTAKNLVKKAIKIMDDLKTLRADRSDLERKVDARRT
jgi:hypothetical protein